MKKGKGFLQPNFELGAGMGDFVPNLGTRIVAASHDARDKAEEVAAGLPFPVAHEVSREQGDLVGAWWDEKGDFMQPTEFILNHSGRVMHSTYSSSPVGRTDPKETLVLLNYRSSRR